MPRSPHIGAGMQQRALDGSEDAPQRRLHLRNCRRVYIEPKTEQNRPNGRRNPGVRHFFKLFKGSIAGRETADLAHLLHRRAVADITDPRHG